jgi:hypothetical protein
MVKAATEVMCLVLLLWAGGRCQAQENPLERKLSLSIEQVKLEDALFLISETGAFNFCYNSTLIEGRKPVNVQVNGKAVSAILSDLFGEQMDFLPVGNHIIIRKRVVTESIQTEQQVEISGLVIDDWSGQRLANVTVFEDFRKKAVQTDEQGRFSFKLPGTIRSVALSLSKVGYMDTSIVILPQKSMRLIVGMARVGVSGPVAVRTPGEIRLNGSETFADMPLPPTDEQPKTFRPKTPTPVQISAFPMVGSNGINKIGTDNYFSFNVFAGLTKGVKGVELGSVANVNREQMYGFQVAGAANIVGTDVKGWQLTSGYNYVKGDATGVQTSGIGNHVVGSMVGWQYSMGINIVQGEAEGLQMTGLLNYARKIKGVQFGLINISDTIKGAAIGLINISKNGYLRVEVGSNDVLHNNLRFKSGTNAFYTVLEGGARWSSTGYAGYGVGGGIGSRVVYAKKRMFTEFEVDVLWMNENQALNFDLNLIHKFSVTLGVRVAGPMEFQVGPTFVYHHSMARSADGSFNSELGFFPFYREERPDIGLLQQMWVGIQAGIQFDLNWRRPGK